jgi:hypothetical protein
MPPCLPGTHSSGCVPAGSGQRSSSRPCCTRSPSLTPFSRRRPRKNAGPWCHGKRGKLLGAGPILRTRCTQRLKCATHREMTLFISSWGTLASWPSLWTWFLLQPLRRPPPLPSHPFLSPLRPLSSLSLLPVRMRTVVATRALVSTTPPSALTDFSGLTKKDDV